MRGESGTHPPTDKSRARRSARRRGRWGRGGEKACPAAHMLRSKRQPGCSGVKIAAESKDIFFFIRPLALWRHGRREGVILSRLPRPLAHFHRLALARVGSETNLATFHGCPRARLRGRSVSVRGPLGLLWRRPVHNRPGLPGLAGGVLVTAPMWAQAPKALGAGRPGLRDGHICNPWVHTRLKLLQRRQCGPWPRAWLAEVYKALLPVGSAHTAEQERSLWICVWARDAHLVPQAGGMCRAAAYAPEVVGATVAWGRPT